MKLSEKTIRNIKQFQNKYPEKRSALIPALHLAQAEIGYLPHEIQEEVATLFNLDVNDVNSVVTFYDMFYEKPVGNHIIHVCKNVSCMLRGCDELMIQTCERLGVQPGETTKDKEFTVIGSECLGACDRAPMMLVDKVVFGPVNENDLDKILEEAKNWPKHPSPTDALEDKNG